MALNVPFPSPFTGGLPLPRRFVLLGATAVALLLFLHTFAPSTLPPVLTPNLPHHEPDASYFSPSKWIPPILNGHAAVKPLEFDEEGQCLFVSPFGALSAAEKARAASIQLEEVSPGIVRTKPAKAGSDDDPDFDGDAANSALQQGLTHPILALLRDGEVKWNEMLAAQSKTLEQSVETYIERYGRQPPKGYDLWYVARLCMVTRADVRWQFASSRNVLLPDEYDA